MDNQSTGNSDPLPGDRGGDSGVRRYAVTLQTPRWVKWLVVVIPFALAGTGYAVHLFRMEQQEECQRQVSVRDDNRAMWLYLIEQTPGAADDPEIVAAVEYLDTRLPALHCVSRNAVPK